MKKTPTRRRTAPGAVSREAPPGSVDPIAAARAAAFVTDDPVAALDHFRPLAARVSTEGLAPLNGSPAVMLANVKSALATLEPHLSDVATRFPGARLQDLLELPSLVLALLAASRRVPSRALSDGEIQKLLAEGKPLRDLTLTFLEVASHPLLGIVPAARVRAIRAGKGKLDTAQDFVALATVFSEFEAALSGKHPFTDAMLARLSELGAELVQQVRPGSAAAAEKKRSEESLLRDQLASLVEDRYDHLLVLAAVALGRRKADAVFPALRSAFHAAPTEKAPEAEGAGKEEAKGEAEGEAKGEG